VGSAASVLSVGSWASLGSLLSAESRWSALSWRSRGGVLAAGAGLSAVALLAPITDELMPLGAVFPEDAHYRPDAGTAHEEPAKRLAVFTGPVGEAVASVTDPTSVVHARISQVTVEDPWHVGRIVLAGDAAHLNSPAGGQAMNTGFADATALAWRLAALVEGRAGDGVLADYARERRHAAAEVGRATSALGLLQAMREATTQDLHRRVQETLAGYAEAWSQLYTTYAARPAAALPRRETYQLVPGARVPGHVPHPNRPVALFRPGVRPESYRGTLPAGTRGLALSTRQSAWLPAGADAVLVRPDRHVAAVLAPDARRPDGTPDHRREEVAA
ncbi:FAD-dependent monooxygenase, partial [Streptomyces anthocyanicus]|uniref:FAD-dependent monooxygenase n=1 Tax=Streptomyces anthocyanicus TaxID=68174 RepID=UPI003651AFF8